MKTEGSWSKGVRFSRADGTLIGTAGGERGTESRETPAEAAVAKASRETPNEEQAAEALKLTSKDMLANKLIDGIIKEPCGGAHTNPKQMFTTVKKEILKDLSALKAIDKKQLVENRIAKFCAMGVVNE